MECPSRRGFRAAALALLVVVVLVFAGFAHSQGLLTSPYGAPSMLRGLSEQGFRQGESDTVSISSGMFPSILPPIPNLQIGYLYNFGPNVRSGRFTADYLLPFNLSRESTVFGEAHTEFQSFWQNTGYNNRVDVSLGGGYRTIRRNNTLLGVNGFYDTSRLGGTWYSSGGVGFEMAALLPGNDALDLNFNWYGNLFSGNVISNAFRYGPSNFDVQAGYSHEIWNGGPDLRLSATGYKFNAGDSVYGYNAQAELKSRDGAFVLRYNVGNDRINKTYQTVGGFVNVGFRPENLLSGESPFTMPEPIFKSPRNLWYMLTQTVKRNWHQPVAALIRRSTTNPSGDVWFSVDCEGQVSAGHFAGLPATGASALLDMREGSGVGGYYVEYQRYSINFIGDTAGLPAIVPVTVTWNNVPAVNNNFEWGAGDTDNGSMTLNIPKTGGTIGNGGTVLDTAPDNRPNVFGGDRVGTNGTVTFEAPGVNTLTITVYGYQKL